ncbi:MAG: pyridoxal kinase [Alphaproteobacteria bacterium]|nr:pyridoxal kinase [Alphaproteobacteria bacterium]
MKTILSISSQVAGARIGAGVTAFAAERLGVRVLTIPTVLYGRRPDRGAPGGMVVEAATIASMIHAMAEDGALAKVDAVLSGYVGAPAQIEVVLDAVDRVKSANKNAIYCCDPIMGDENGLYVKEDVAGGVVDGLVRQADWITPNAWEMERITGRPCTDLADARGAARRFGRPALISSIASPGGIGVLYAAPTGDWLCETPKLANPPKGTGDLLTALFLARRLRGDAAVVALEASTGAVYDLIVRSAALGADELALTEAQDILADPKTWPRAQHLGV